MHLGQLPDLLCHPCSGPTAKTCNPSHKFRAKTRSGRVEASEKILGVMFYLWSAAGTSAARANSFSDETSQNCFQVADNRTLRDIFRRRCGRHPRQVLPHK